MDKIIDFLYEIALNNLAYYDSILPKLDVIFNGLFQPILWVLLFVFFLALILFGFIIWISDLFESGKHSPDEKEQP